MKEKQTELEKSYRKNKFYTWFYRGLSITMFAGILGLTSSQIYTSLIKDNSLERKISEIKTEVIQLQENKDIISKYETISITELEDIIQTKKIEAQEIEYSPAYIAQENKDEIAKKVKNYSLLISFLSFGLMFASHPYALKIEDEFDRLEQHEDIKLYSTLIKYMKINPTFTLDELKNELKDKDVEYKLLNISPEKQLSMFVKEKRLTYDEENKLYHTI